ncbi:MAG: methyltransferase [Hyphomicrobiaceae bacterium]|nr:methyltransferase [Hyphomicrobiaceae bacterium]
MRGVSLPRTGMLGRFADRLAELRGRLAANPKFHAAAVRNPLTRPIARRKARKLFDLVAGFVYSQVLFAGVKVGLFRALATGPLDLSEVASACDLPEAEARRLVDAAASLDLVAWRADGRVGLADLGAALVANPGVIAMIEHHDLLYADLADPVGLMRGERRRGDTALGAYWPYATAAEPGALDDAAVAAYSRLMGASQTLIAGEVLDAYSVTRHRRLLDIGGGDGTFCVAAAAHAPNLHVGLFDLPAVAERARARFAHEGIADRATATGGDFDRDPLPAGADLVSLVRVLYDHDDDKALRILAAARRAIASGGTLLIAEPMARAPGSETVGDAYFGFYLLAMGSGRARAPEELGRMALVAGFAAPRIVSTRMPLQTGLVVATA